MRQPFSQFLVVQMFGLAGLCFACSDSKEVTLNQSDQAACESDPKCPCENGGDGVKVCDLGTHAFIQCDCSRATSRSTPTASSDADTMKNAGGGDHAGTGAVAAGGMAGMSSTSDKPAADGGKGSSSAGKGSSPSSAGGGATARAGRGGAAGSGAAGRAGSNARGPVAGSGVAPAAGRGGRRN